MRQQVGGNIDVRFEYNLRPVSPTLQYGFGSRFVLTTKTGGLFVVGVNL